MRIERVVEDNEFVVNVYQDQQLIGKAIYVESVAKWWTETHDFNSAGDEYVSQYSGMNIYIEESIRQIEISARIEQGGM